MDVTPLAYYYGAWFFGKIGLFILFIAMLFYKYKTGKILLGVGFVFLIPILLFAMMMIQQRIEIWYDLSPMQKAIASNRYNKVKRLIKDGYDVNEDNINSYPPTPLTYAVDKGRIRIVKLLTENGADINLSPRGRGNPLVIAIDRGDTAIVNYLLAQGADVSTKENFDPIVCAIRSFKPNSKNVIESLIKYGADINANNGAALREAISPHDHTNEIACYLLEQGAEVPDLPAMKKKVQYCLDNISVINSKRYADSLQLVKIMKLLEEYTPPDKAE